jgi:hypothetical protein
MISNLTDRKIKVQEIKIIEETAVQLLILRLDAG